MQPTKITDTPQKLIMEGFVGNYYHSQTMSIGWLDAKAGYSVPLHQHPHEQISYVQQGNMIFNIEGKEFNLEAGMAITIAPNLMHGATAVTDCKLIDVFSPVREDFK